MAIVGKYCEGQEKGYYVDLKIRQNGDHPDIILQAKTSAGVVYKDILTLDMFRGVVHLHELSDEEAKNLGVNISHGRIMIAGEE